MIRLRCFLVYNKSKERPQVASNDCRMLLYKATVKLSHSFHFLLSYKAETAMLNFYLLFRRKKFCLEALLTEALR